MKKQINSLLKKAMWVSIILFGIRCAASFEEIKTNLSLYSLFGYAGEAIGVAAIFMVIYDKWLWRFDPFERIPCIKGVYFGNIKSSYDSAVREATLQINQTFLSIRAIMTTSESKSKSVAASIENNAGINEFIFTYHNEPKAERREESPIHYGTARFMLDEKDHLSGQYFTDRKTIGDLDFTKEN